jgi:hypothetical protein
MEGPWPCTDTFSGGKTPHREEGGAAGSRSLGTLKPQPQTQPEEECADGRLERPLIGQSDEPFVWGGRWERPRHHVLRLCSNAPPGPLAGIREESPERKGNALASRSPPITVNSPPFGGFAPPSNRNLFFPFPSTQPRHN